MKSDLKLVAGAMVALGIATAALVVLPYVQVRDIAPPPQLKPYSDAQARHSHGSGQHEQRAYQRRRPRFSNLTADHGRSHG